MEDTIIYNRIIDPQLQHWVIEKIQFNIKLKHDLGIMFNRSQNSIDRWLRQNRRELSSDHSIRLISEYLNIDTNSLIERRKN